MGLFVTAASLTLTKTEKQREKGHTCIYQALTQTLFISPVV